MAAGSQSGEWGVIGPASAVTPSTATRRGSGCRLHRCIQCAWFTTPSFLGPPPTQQVSAQQQILLLWREDLQGDRAVVAGRLELLDVLRPVGLASRGGSQRQVLVGGAVVLGQVNVPQLVAKAVQVLVP